MQCENSTVKIEIFIQQMINRWKNIQVLN